MGLKHVHNSFNCSTHLELGNLPKGILEPELGINNLVGIHSSLSVILKLQTPATVDINRCFLTLVFIFRNEIWITANKGWAGYVDFKLWVWHITENSNSNYSKHNILCNSVWAANHAAPHKKMKCYILCKYHD